MQTDYQDIDGALTKAIEGGRADASYGNDVTRTAGANVPQVETLTVGTPVIAVAQVSTLTITTAATGDVFVVKINGVIVATDTSSGTDKTVQRDAIEALLLANAYFVANFTVADNSTDALDITALQDGEPFGVEVTVDATSVYTWTETTPNVVGTQLKSIINGIETHLAADTTTIATETAAFLVLLQAQAEHTGVITFTAGGSGEIICTAAVAGVPFSVTWVNETIDGVPGTPALSSDATTANVTGNPVPFGRGVVEGSDGVVATLPSTTGFLFAGVAMFKNKESPNDGSGAKYEAGEAITVGRKTVVWVLAEDIIAIDDDVYLRHTLGTAVQLPGRFRTDADTAKADQVTQARWLSTTSGADELAKLEINVP